MKLMLRFAVVSIALATCFSLARAQNTPTPKPEDAEKNAFQTPTTGQQSPPDRSKQTKSDANPESRLNDEPPAHEKAGTTNNSGK